MQRLLTLTERDEQAIDNRIREDIAARTAALRQKLEALAEWLDTDGSTSGSVSEFEQGVDAKLKEVGVAAVEAYVAGRRKVPERKVADDDGRTHKYDREKVYPLRTIFGVGTYEASCFVRGAQANRRSEREFVPHDALVGLLPVGGGLSPSIVLEAAELATRMPFDHVKDVLGRFYGYAPCKRSILGLIDLVGPVAQDALNDVELESGEVAVVQVDARGLPRIQSSEYNKRCNTHKKSGRTRGRWRRVGERKKPVSPHNRKGKKRGKKKQVTVGLIYTLKRTSDGKWEGPYGKVVARLGDCESVFATLAAQLEQLKEKPRKTIFISDGAEHLADFCKRYLPDAIHVIDYYHVCEYLWDAATAAHGEGNKETMLYFERLKERLRTEGPAPVLASLRAHLATIPKKGPGNKGRRKRLSDAIRYISKRVDQMPYRQQREEGLEIASGAIESAVRQVVAIRFDGPGMRWGGQRSQVLLTLVCVRLSSGWDKLRTLLEKSAHQPREKQRMTPIGVAEAKRSRSGCRPPDTMIGMPEAA